MTALVMNLALGASFLYGAYQTWKVQNQKVTATISGHSVEKFPDKFQQSFNIRTKLDQQERILKFWVVMMSMLTLVPIFDFFLGWLFGPLWTIARLVLFWQVAAYPRTRTSGILFEQWEHSAKSIEGNIRDVVLLGRQFRTALIDFLATIVAKLFLILTDIIVIYLSRDMLQSAKAKLKLINIAFGNELEKVDRPGHKRDHSQVKGWEKEDADISKSRPADRIAEIAGKSGAAADGKVEQKESVISRGKVKSQRKGLRRRKKDGYVK